MQRAVVFTGAGQPLELTRSPTAEPRVAELLVRARVAVVPGTGKPE
jgi:hypothetical protein